MHNDRLPAVSTHTNHGMMTRSKTHYHASEYIATNLALEACSVQPQVHAATASENHVSKPGIISQDNIPQSMMGQTPSTHNRVPVKSNGPYVGSTPSSSLHMQSVSAFHDNTATRNDFNRQSEHPLPTPQMPRHNDYGGASVALDSVYTTPVNAPVAGLSSPQTSLPSEKDVDGTYVFVSKTAGSSTVQTEVGFSKQHTSCNTQPGGMLQEQSSVGTPLSPSPSESQDSAQLAGIAEGAIISKQYHARMHAVLGGDEPTSLEEKSVTPTSDKPSPGNADATDPDWVDFDNNTYLDYSGQTTTDADQLIFASDIVATDVPVVRYSVEDFKLMVC